MAEEAEAEEKKRDDEEDDGEQERDGDGEDEDEEEIWGSRRIKTKTRREGRWWRFWRRIRLGRRRWV